MSEVEAALASLQSRLGESELYTASHRDELAALLQQEGRLKAQATALEERWLELQEQLEQVEGC
jgi:ATP-binding cassette subfamily F protein 3